MILNKTKCRFEIRGDIKIISDLYAGMDDKDVFYLVFEKYCYIDTSWEVYGSYLCKSDKTHLTNYAPYRYVVDLYSNDSDKYYAFVINKKGVKVLIYLFNNWIELKPKFKIGFECDITDDVTDSIIAINLI